MDDPLKLIEKFESPNVTYIGETGKWPVVWESARGCKVTDVSGKEYLDLTSAFGVCVLGHANPNVVKAGQLQMEKLMHAMGDVHPHRLKANLCRELSLRTFERWANAGPEHSRIYGRSILCNSGFEAVEAGLKSAILATGRKEVLAFEGGYHGLGYGALMATHRQDFRSPFIEQIGGQSHWLPFPDASSNNHSILEKAQNLFSTRRIGAVIVEPIQARGGIREFPEKFLRTLKDLAKEFGVIVIFDEIYTGFCRTGRWFACEHYDVQPDIICLGKALTGGFPMSACVGRNDLMELSWPRSKGESIHTSTFLGHPVGCAMALEQLRQLEACDADGLSELKGTYLMNSLKDIFKAPEFEVKGKGMMVGLKVVKEGPKRVWNVVQKSLESGFIFLPCGSGGDTLAWTPPFNITNEELDSSVHCVANLLLNS